MPGKALIRPGRFDRRVFVGATCAKGRALTSTALDFEALARRTHGFTGAELESLVSGAARAAVRDAELPGSISTSLTKHS